MKKRPILYLSKYIEFSKTIRVFKSNDVVVNKYVSACTTLFTDFLQSCSIVLVVSYLFIRGRQKKVAK